MQSVTMDLLKKTLKGCDYMSNNDYILNLLNIEDKNIFILNNNVVLQLM